MSILMPSFNRYPKEADLIGRMLAGYGELEFALAHCVSMIAGDPDAVFKAMFRVRGETNRVKIADALARGSLQTGAYRTAFETMIAGMYECLSIRNQYAHCNWLDAPSTGLMFVNLEEVAAKNAEIDLTKLSQFQAPLSMLQEQYAFFIHVAHCIDWLNYEIRFRDGRLKQNHVPKPKRMDAPALHGSPYQPIPLGNIGKRKRT